MGINHRPQMVIERHPEFEAPPDPGEHSATGALLFCPQLV